MLSVWLVCWLAGFPWLGFSVFMWFDCGLVWVAGACLPFGAMVWCVCSVVPRL